jgi:hypothetical protein
MTDVLPSCPADETQDEYDLLAEFLVERLSDVFHVVDKGA